MTNVKNLSGLKPLGRAVLVKPYLVEERTASGLILTRETVQKDQMAEQRAVVVEIGPAAWESEKQPRAKVGDKILFSKWAGYQAVGTADDEVYRVVNDSDIFMGITEEKVNGR
jgi:co-chaperonin GroES (HSP10)